MRKTAQSAGVAVRNRVRAINRWRDSFNPLRGLTMPRAVALIEGYQRGEMADLQWTLAAPGVGLESADADLLALVERCISPILEMDWNVKAVKGAEQTPQLKVAEDLLNGITNLHEAIEHLAMARFRGFAHCEIARNADGDVVELTPVDQWNVVRDGSRGQWKYNPEARSISYGGLPDELIMEPEHFLIRTVSRPLWRVALIAFIRKSLSQKDWDAFVEIYGVPGGIVILPPDVPVDKETAYLAVAEEAARGGHAALPNGSSYVANDGPRGVNPFRDHLRWQQEQLVLAGTGGKLTMLAESGSGTLGGSAHADTFRSIAASEARRISEVIQRQLIEPALAAAFPGQDVEVYFELAFNEETDTGKFVADVQSLSSAGFQVSAAQITEKTGYEVLVKPEPAAPSIPEFRNRNIANSLGKDAQDQELFLRSAAEKLGSHPDIAAMLEEILNADDENFETEIEALKARIPSLMDGNPEAVQAWEEVLGTALVSGLAENSTKRKK